MIFRQYFLLLTLLLSTSIQAQYELKYKWKDEFTDAEKEKVKEWIQITYDAVQHRIGKYPFDVHLFIYRREGKGEPCPWANTWRYPNQQVHFHIDPSYSLEEFLSDWTAPHELSHLAIPYIGEEEPWFSEGFASFMQYQVMEEMRKMTVWQVDSAYKAKISLIETDYNEKSSFAEQAMKNKSNGNYKAMYWGGASLFLQWNKQLEKDDKNLCELFPEYLKNYRKSSRGVDGVVQDLDKVSGQAYGSQLLKTYRSEGLNLGKMQLP